MGFDLQHYIETGLLDEMRAQIRGQEGRMAPVVFQAAAATGAQKYVGDKAGDAYRKKREGTPKWEVEQKIIERMLGKMPMGNWVLDVPCGEGRFFEFYAEQGYCFRGIDVSADQLQAAAKRVKDPMKARLARGDVRDLNLDDKCVDASVMCRLTRWLSEEDCQRAMKELMRVTRDRIVITARKGGQYPRPKELFESVLEDGWELAEDVAGYEEDYRILLFKRRG